MHLSFVRKSASLTLAIRSSHCHSVRSKGDIQALTEHDRSDKEYTKQEGNTLRGGNLRDEPQFFCLHALHKETYVKIADNQRGRDQLK